MRVFGLCLCLAFAVSASAQTLEQKAQALIDAYPDHVAGFDGTSLLWKDGTKMRFGSGREDKPLDELLDSPDVADMFRWTYPFGASGVPAAKEADPGRVRNEPFFEKMYGECRKEPPGGCARVTCTSRGRLERVPWLPKSGGGVMQAASINSAAAKLRLVARDLEALGPEFVRYLTPSGGSYAPRCIAKTTRLSVHSFGIAFDINPSYGQYWQYGLPGTLNESQVRERNIPLVYKNKIPLEIVAVFEKHGFIWGGKWYHFDGMHFEYRPEFLALKAFMEK
jgi:D-alanyl-D-alanine carboxypeptidase